jgi:hypothetical protein
LSKMVRRRRNRRIKALAIAYELIRERGEVSTEEINRELSLRNVKSSTQYVGLIMREPVFKGIIERTRWGNNRSAYRFSKE